MSGLGLFRWATAYVAIFGVTGGLALISATQLASTPADASSETTLVLWIALVLGILAVVSLILAGVGLGIGLIGSAPVGTSETQDTTTEAR